MISIVTINKDSSIITLERYQKNLQKIYILKAAYQLISTINIATIEPKKHLNNFKIEFNS